MFWRKKVEVEGKPITLSKRIVYITDLFGDKKTVNSFLAYKDIDEWRGLVGYEQFKETTDLLNKKLDLILKELGKEYVPESSKTEPAKLVGFKDKELNWADLITISGGGTSYIDDSAKTTMNTTKPKKKRGRPKKK